MRKVLLGLIMVFCVGVWPVQAADEPSDKIVRFCDTLVSVMKNGKQLGFDGRVKALTPAIDQTFAMPEMTRHTLGSAAKNLTPEQMSRLTEAFRRYTIANYASNFDEYNGERFDVGQTRSSTGDSIVVPTKLVFASKSAPVSLDYVMSQAGGKWGVTDVLAEGSVSQVAMRRSEFVSVLRRDGFDALLKTIDHKTQMLAGKS